MNPWSNRRIWRSCGLSGWPVPKGMDVAHDGNGYAPRDWLILAYYRLIAGLFCFLIF